jgi:hypothetical protein
LFCRYSSFIEQRSALGGEPPQAQPALAAVSKGIEVRAANLMMRF